jgi:hypothetical protein
VSTFAPHLDQQRRHSQDAVAIIRAEVVCNTAKVRMRRVGVQACLS